MKKETRTFIVDELQVMKEEGKATRIAGHAAVFNSRSQDLGGFVEQISPGAFKDAINEDDVRALFNHDPNFILGRNKSNTLRMKEDKTGLAIEIDMPDTQYARDLVESMNRGDVDQMSFGFGVRAEGQSWSEDPDGRAVRTLTNLKLYDVSPVTYPAYTDTDVAVRELRSFKEAKESENKKISNAYYKRKMLEIT